MSDVDTSRDDAAAADTGAVDASGNGHGGEQPVHGAVERRAQQAARRVHGVPAPEREAPAYAGFVTRTIAFAIDAAIIDLVGAVVAGVVALVFSIVPVSKDTRTAAAAIGAVVFVIWSAAYFVVLWTTTGETVGNRVMQIRVTRSDGARLRPRHALIRLVGMLISLPFFWGYLPILVNDRRRGVPDRMAGTVVVNAPRPRPS